VSEEITVMPKELRDAPVTEVLTGCPCCDEALVISVRVAGNELCVGLSSVQMRVTHDAILKAADGAFGNKK